MNKHTFAANNANTSQATIALYANVQHRLATAIIALSLIMSALLCAACIDMHNDNITAESAVSAIVANNNN